MLSEFERRLMVESNEGSFGDELEKEERGRFSPTRYFVEEVIGFDETDLYRSWVRASSTRSPQERNTRLENMCWRIWNLARQKKQLESEAAQRVNKRRLERERGRREATANMSEDLSEGEKGDPVKYVVELAKALGSMSGVYRVDLLTRQVAAPDVDWSYAEPTEMLTPRDVDDYGDDMGESSGSYIVCIPFGPRDKYIPKELLWPYIPEFVDGALNHIIQMSKSLGEQIGSGHAI
ncbi:sucrose-phosphate synthase [Vigna angularis]|uniref:Sucrose-phosphate synthase n=1 Tax=Phaseolus angularis TaxID=3914 RepID=A0A8T0L0U4_PHAAN|nr:sucrose-phosphate synthase [Vigna angularis]